MLPYKVLKFFDDVTSALVAVLLALLAVYAGYALWDNQQVYAAAEEVQASLLTLKPQEGGVPFAELRAVNADVCAWVTLDGTGVDYPVVQGKDNEEYKRLNELYYGPDMVVDDNIAMEWAPIPPFYYNYYVFQYATGYAAAIALSRRILREGAPAVKDYIGFLSGGCSKSPIDLLKGAGVDMSTTKPVEEALSLFGELIGEMEELMKD